MSDSQPGRAPLRFALYSSSLGNYFFHEIRDLIGAGLRELGHAVEFRDEKQGFNPRVDWQVIIAPHEFFHLGKGESLAAQSLPENLVLFNTEQPSTQWFELAAKHFPKAAALWDIDFESSLRITKDGHPCSYLPLGHAGKFSMFQPVPELPVHEETQRLPAEVRNGDFFPQPFLQRPLDLLFLGHASGRREKFFTKHAARLNPFRNYLYRPTVLRPLIPGETTNMNTLTSIGLAQRSKILLNVHHGVDKYFEWHRIVLLGVAQRTLVLTEPCSLAPPFRANMDFVEAPLDELPARAEYHLRSEAGQREAQAIIERGYETLTRGCRISEMLRPLVGALQERSRLNCASVSHIISPEFVPTPNAQPLSVCVVTPDVAGEPGYADAGTSQIALAERFAAQGHRVTLLHTKHKFGTGKLHGYWSVHFAARGIQYVAVPPDLEVPLASSEASARSYETFLWLKQRAFDVVHFPETEGIAMYSMLARSQGLAFERTRLCLNSHGPRAWRRQASEQFVTSPYDLELDYMERECFRLADALVTSTEFMSGWLEQQKWALPAVRSLCADRIAVRQNVSPSANRPVDVLAYVGSLQRSSELELFCQAIERLNDDEKETLDIVFFQKRKDLSAANDADYIRRRLRPWNLKWRVAEYEEADDLFRKLAQPGWLTVLTSPQENSSWLVRGCLEHGVRFLATRTGGTPELILGEDHAATLFVPRSASLTALLKPTTGKAAVAPRPNALRSSLSSDWFAAHENWLRQSDGKGPSPAAPQDSSSLPLVSVCLVHFNRPEYLKQSLASLRAQDYPNFEVVLVDDGSTKPEAIEFLKSLEPEFKRRGWQMVRQDNRYLGAARNTGARHARGEYLVFMDDDNVAKPHELSTFIRVARYTGADFLTSAMDVFVGHQAPDSRTRPRARWVFLGAAAATGAIRNCFGDANGCMRREAFWRVGGFTEDYGITHEDWEFYARAVLQGCRLETIPEALFWYRTAAGSMIHSTPIHANLQRSLRPYVATLPEPLGGLMHLIQGTTCAQSAWEVAVPDYHDLLALHQSLLSAGRELSLLGRKSEAEAIFLKVLHSAETIGHAPLQLRTLMSAAVVLAPAGAQTLAKALLERAAKLAAVSQDQVAADEVRLLQETLTAGGDLGDVAVRIKLFEGESAGKPQPVANAPVAAHRDPSPLRGSSSDAAKTKSTPLTSVVVLAHNQLVHTQSCVESLFAHTRAPFELILVDNGSTDGTANFFAELCQRHENVKVVTNRTNRGFAAGNNQGLALAKGELIVLLNNDTVVTEGWVEGLSSALAQHPETGIVGPMSNRVSGPQFVSDVDYTELSQLPAFATAWSKAHAGQSIVVNRAVGFCLIATRAVIEKIGGLDERFGSGNFEDDDFCIRAKLAGFGIRIAQDVFIHHTGSQTFQGERIDYRAAMTRNWEFFRTKWQLPPEASLAKGYRTPETLPASVALQSPLPTLSLTHRADGDRHWIEQTMAVPAKRELPAVAGLGRLHEARALFKQRELGGAWSSTVAALATRPFHPEAYLLLAEIAQAAGDGASARRCAEFTRKLAPEWAKARQFLKGNLKGSAKLDWLVLPEALRAANSSPRTRLSVCLIVRNEEQFLEACLRSVKSVAHQIIVVDTGSTDRTVEIARTAGAEVHSFTWCDDFAAARNEALSHARGDWVLSLDADEQLDAATLAELDKHLRSEKVMAWRLPLVDHGREAEGSHYVPRLFRNAPGVHWSGRIHEHAFGSIEALRRDWGLDNKTGFARIIHFGYAKEVSASRDKTVRNLRLLEQALVENPEDANLLMNLGLELHHSGREEEALAQYRAAFRQLTAQSADEVVPELRETLLVQFTTRLLAGKHFAEIAEVLRSPLAQRGLSASLQFNLGLASMSLGRWAEGAAAFKSCLATRKQSSLGPINADIQTGAPWHCLAECLREAGEFDAADKTIAAGLKEHSDFRPLRREQAQLLLATAKPVEALQLLNELVAADSGDAESWRLGGAIALSRFDFHEFAADWTSEAMKLHASRPEIVSQRAEALLLARQPAGAAELLRGRSLDARGSALLLLAETLAHSRNATLPGDEPAVSRAFLDFYRSLIQRQVEPLIRDINESLDRLEPVLPTATGWLRSVLAEAQAA